MIVADGNTEEDQDIVGFFRVFHDEYTKIKDVFKSGENVLVMYKNIITISKYDWRSSFSSESDYFTVQTNLCHL